MPNPGEPRAVFLAHAVAAGATAALLFAQLVDLSLSPVDLFVHAHAVLLGQLQYALALAVFYGFSLALMHLVPPPTRWGVPYVGLSWLFGLWAFFPSQAGLGGMMRRISTSPEVYMAAQRRGQWLRLAVVLIFALLQVAYLAFVVRELRRRRITPSV